MANGQILPSVDLPSQSAPPLIEKAKQVVATDEINQETNLVLLLDKIRVLTTGGRLLQAQELASSALSNLEKNEENEFYLRQIKSEETKLYFKLANEAMASQKYELASQYIERYRQNVSEDLIERKAKRSVTVDQTRTQNVSLVGKLVEELDQAKKDLAEIRAKTGLPENDAKPDLQRLVDEEKSKIESGLRKAETLLARARLDSSKGRYELAEEQLDQALSMLTPNAGTIAIISDIYKAKQQVVWFEVGEAMLKGKVGQVQELVVKFKQIEDAKLLG